MPGQANELEKSDSPAQNGLGGYASVKADIRRLYAEALHPAILDGLAVLTIVTFSLILIKLVG
jgi:hypothetical protein